MRVVSFVIFILFPFLSKAHSTETEHTNPQSSPDSIHIYVSPQVTIVGIEHVYHGEIIIIKEQKKIIAENSGALKRRSNPLVKEKSIERKAVESQEKKLQKKAAPTYVDYTVTEENFQQERESSKIAVISTSNNHIKWLLFHSNDNYQTSLSNFCFEQNFYTSQLILHCSKVVNSFLRGPPANSFS